MFHFFAKSKGVVANKTLQGRAYHDAVVYVTLIQMVFMMMEVETF